MVKWQSPLVSQLRYNAHLQSADTIIRQLHECDNTLATLTWLPPQILDVGTLELAEVHDENTDDLESLDMGTDHHDTASALLNDLLSDSSDYGDDDYEEEDDSSWHSHDSCTSTDQQLGDEEFSEMPPINAQDESLVGNAPY